MTEIEPISDAELAAICSALDGLPETSDRPYRGMIARIRALEAEREAAIVEFAGFVNVLRAEVARKDAALRPFAEAADNLDGEPDDACLWEHPVSTDLDMGHLRAARAALGPWVPTHQHYKGGYCRAHASGFMGWARGNPVVILENEDGIWIVVQTGEFAEDVREFDDDGMFKPPAPRYRPLTPDEARAAVEGRS